MSEQFPIDPSSLSYSSIKKDLTDWLLSLPDSEQWTLFFESSTGQQIVELISAMYAMTKFDNIVGRREAYIQFSKNRSSKIGSAQSLGYSAYRGRNSVVKVKIVPTGTGVWEKYDIIGTVSNKDLIVLEPTVYNAGVEVELECVIGEVASQEIQSNTDALNAFRFTDGNVSEDVRIFIDGNEISFSTEVTGMLKGEFQLQTNSFESVDAKYLNLTSFTHRYGVGSIIRLQWVELSDLDYAISDVKVDEIEGTLTDIYIVSLYKDRERKDNIAINAPLKNETKMNVRGKKDQAKVLKQLDTKIISAEGETVTNGVMELFYLLDDDTRYTPAQKEALLNEFEPYRPHGLLPPILSEGKRANRIMQFTIVRQPNTTGDILAKIDEVISALEYKLKGAINIYDIESELEGTDYIKIARIAFTASIWEALHPYEFGSMAKLAPDNGYIYEVLEHIYRSGSVTPTWPVINETIFEDGDLVWQTFIKSDVTEIAIWQPNTVYSLHSKVRPATPNEFAYKLIGFVNRSGSVEPVWPTAIGDEIADGSILWKCLELSGTQSAWQGDTKYLGGSVIIPTTANGKMYQAYSFVRNSGTTLPTFPTVVGERVVDGDIMWECKDPKEIEQELLESQYYVIETETTVS